MTEKRMKSKKKKDLDAKAADDKPSKVEYEVAKYLRSKLPQKKTSFLGHKVEYFISSKAIDCLLDSKWASIKEKNEKDALFTTRESVIDFMDEMLRHKLFHRARKIIVKSEPKKKKADQEESSAEPEDLKDKKESKKEVAKKEKDEKSSLTKTAKAGQTEKESGDNKEKEPEKKKEKRKIKLDMHLTQVFVDGNEPFVWIYDPIPLKAWLIGLGMVFGAVAICLFPLWPRVVRNYVYYLSIAAAGFLFFIIGLAVLRLIIFCLVWLVSFGKHHFWLLPNLTEDVGFMASFWPLYQHDYFGSEGEDDKDSKKKKDKDSGGDEVGEVGEVEEEANDKGSDQSDSQNKDSEDSGENGNGPKNGSDNGFEILDSNDLNGEEGESGDGSEVQAEDQKS